MSISKTDKLIECRKKIGVWCDHIMEHIHVLGGQNSGFLNVSVGGTYAYHLALNR
jgi:hypothetical protein